MTHDVVIVGGGFGGVAAMKALAKKAPADCRVTLLSETNYTTFSPLLPEVVSTSVLPGQVVAPLRQMLGDRQRFVMGRAVAVDLAAGRLRYEADGAVETLSFDDLVVAVGARARLDPVPGLAEQAIPLKLVGDALGIRNRVIARLERADHTADPDERRRLLHVAVVGGGFSGVEVAGEIHDFMEGAQRFYPGIGREETRVSIVHAGDRLLPELPEALGEKARRDMERRGIAIHLSAKASAADADGLAASLADGTETRIEAATLVSTIGTAPNPFVETVDAPLERGRIRVAPDLSVAGTHGLWAIGDCAHIKSEAIDGPAPPTAQFAVEEAKTVAANILRRRAGRQTRPFTFGGLGTIATIGNQRGIADVMGVPVTGFPAWLMWRMVYLLRMPTLGRKARIYVEWTWDMLFRRDVAQLDFAASSDAAPPRGR